ncbi:prolyl-tRNA synthetase [Candidatus Peregrinibacteria bacterium]|nr:MAG: prolyl-tRNA synthetase [Candidatus Peregrinibacteria bacterium]
MKKFILESFDEKEGGELMFRKKMSILCLFFNNIKMNFLSNHIFSTLKTIPQGSDNRGTGLLLQAGFIRQEMAGVYIFLPMGLRVLRNIESIIRDELDAIGAQEILMTALGSKEHWMTTGRWDQEKMDILFHVPASRSKEYALNPTHEEIVTPLMNEFVRSYKNLPAAVYQFQTKFRNEVRAKSGLLRGREFLMKDLYSFHETSEHLDVYFEKVREAYVSIFNRLEIGDKTHYAFASGGAFSKYSYEFQTELGIGEDTLYVCDACGQKVNNELIQDNNFICPSCEHTSAHTITTSEVGNIFKLGDKFSKDFQLKTSTKDGSNIIPVMGCYGIGVSRLMGVIAEIFADDVGLIWPKAIAPYTDYILVQCDNKKSAIQLALQLEKSGKKVLIDDRDMGFGKKAKDADLFGIPNRIVISEKTLAKGGYELKVRGSSVETIVQYDFDI